MTEDRKSDGLDPEIRAFVKRMGEYWRQHPPLGSVSVVEQRQIAEKVRAPWGKGGPVMARTTEHRIPLGDGSTVRIRALDPTPDGPKPAFIYLHGGGWTFFSIDTHDRIMREYAARAGVVSIGVDYSLSPEAKFPRALEETVAVVKWLQTNGASIGVDGSRIAIGGDSAGAAMTIASCMMLRDAGQPHAVRAMILNYGAFDAACDNESYDLYGKGGYLWDPGEMQGFWRNYMRDEKDATNPLCCPINADVSGLPPAFNAVPQCDVMYTESMIMGERLLRAGVPTQTVVYPGATHSFLEAVSIARISDRAFAEASRWLADMLKARLTVADEGGAPIKLRQPYLLFLGDAPSEMHGKTAFGVHQWAPKACLAQMRLPSANITLGLPDMTPEEAATAGAGSLLIGVAPIGGQLPREWEPILLRAIAAGLDIVSGLHTSLAEIPALVAAAGKRGVALVDVRKPRRPFPVANGKRRTGKRLLTVGTDCALGKKYTALALTEALKARGIDADFRATGQTGIMISGGGIAIDAVVADFIAGAAETLSPDAAPDHWDVIEGQGSVLHPAYAGVTMGLLHGSQPDVLILCHEPTRKHLSGYPDFPIPTLEVAAARYLDLARITNPRARLAGVSLNTYKLDAAARPRAIADTAARMGVPCFDPIATSPDAVVDEILREV